MASTMLTKSGGTPTLGNNCLSIYKAKAAISSVTRMVMIDMLTSQV